MILATVVGGCAFEPGEESTATTEGAAGDVEGERDGLDEEATRRFAGTLVKCELRCSAGRNRVRRTLTTCAASAAAARAVCRSAVRQLDAEFPGCRGTGAVPVSSRPRSCDPATFGGGLGGGGFDGF
jgi:hypothetical protein